MLGDDQDLDAIERRIDDWQAQITQRAAQAKVLSEQLGQLTAVGRAGDGLVEATVGASGGLTRLLLDERTRDQSAARTAEQIMAAVRAAQTELTRLATEATAQTLGLESETGRALVASFANRLPGPARDSGSDG